ncbi:MAG: hypothetical protein H7281_02440 [Bacteriovorax sp.]|nr:hypothetical protein [Bacteriovorax sp.]
MKKILLITSLVVFNINAFPSEVDSFHHRFDSLKDATDQINLNSNKLFDRVLYNTNKDTDNLCNETTLYKNLRKEFHNALFGKFNKYINNSSDIERIKIKTIDSIYGDFTLGDSIVLGFYSKHINDPLASALNIRGHYVGTDKFEHFAGTGFLYFASYYLKKISLDATLAIGQHDESGLLGAYTTGVFSYGDMVAEFNGMRFWNHILSKNEDILGVNLGPYVKCENSRWIKAKQIDFSQYVDDAWDEGVNCSKFRTEKMLTKFKNSIKELERTSGNNYTCPIKRESVSESIHKYGPYSNRIINARWSILD